MEDQGDNYPVWPREAGYAALAWGIAVLAMIAVVVVGVLMR